MAAVGQRLPELAAGGDVEFGEDLGHVVFDITDVNAGHLSLISEATIVTRVILEAVQATR